MCGFSGKVGSENGVARCACNRETMIESVRIENFRCFSELEVGDLKPINVIVGENASGKSTFLEALSLQNIRKPSDLIQLRESRSRGYLDKVARESPHVWDDLFHNFNSDSPIYINIGHLPRLRIERMEDGKISLAWMQVAEDVESKRWISTAPRSKYPCEFIGAHVSQRAYQVAEKLSQLSKEGEAQPIID